MKWIVILITLSCILGSAGPAYGNGLLESIGEALGEFVQDIIWGAFDLQMAIRIRLAIDYDNPDTRPFLLSLVDPMHEGPYSIAQVCDIWDYCNEKWVYISDPYEPFDSFAYASETIAAGLRGDCDDYAILLAAAVRAIGGTAIVSAEFVKELGGHAYTIVHIGSNMEEVALNLLYIMARYSLTLDDYGSKVFAIGIPNCGVWVSLDRTADHPGGGWWGERKHLIDSHYLPTPSKLGLLVEPILIAPQISLEMITREFSPAALQAVLSDG